MKKTWSILLLVTLLLVGCAQDTQQMAPDMPQSSNGQTTDSPETTDPSEDTNTEEPYIVSFEAKTIDGEAYTSDRFADSQITMINVWATYCNPCLSEMPDLGELAQEYDPKEVQIIGIISDVAEDSSDADIQNAKELIDETDAEYPHLLLNQSLLDNLIGGVSSVPTTFFVNSKGEMIGYVIGANEKSVWQGMIAKALSSADVQEGDENLDK